MAFFFHLALNKSLHYNFKQAIYKAKNYPKGKDELTEMTARDQIYFSELRKAFYLGWNVRIR